MATAILLIDPYNDFLAPQGKLNRLLADSMAKTDTIKHMLELLRVGREQKLPVFYCLHQQSHSHHMMGWQFLNRSQQRIRDAKVFETGTWGAEIYQGMEPVAENGDIIVSKHWNSSSFHNTDLDYQLRQKGIRHVVLAGMVAETCFEATARYAYENAYELTCLTDATAGFSQDGKDASAKYHWPLFANRVCTVDEWVKTMYVQ